MAVLGSFSRGSIPVLESLAAFTEARHRVLADNIANVDTPYYKVRDLSPEAFARQLADAIQARATPKAPLRLESTRQVYVDAQGRLSFAPQEVDHHHVLFHDESNRSVEKLMASMAKNTMTQAMATRLLAHEFEVLHVAIRGRT